MRTASRLGRLRYLLGLGVLLGGASLAEPLAAPGSVAVAMDRPAVQADLSVLTFNVKGLPWPVASGRGAALLEVAARLAQLRAEGRQPSVVVLQEAFTGDAKAIGQLAGYPYRVEGPYVRDGGAAAPADEDYGPNGAPLLDSGLIVLSDFPVRDIAREAFPDGACAGYDCLAAKGIVVVTLDVPGKGPVSIATTHFNSRGASGAPAGKTRDAYAQQAAFLARFLERVRDPAAPLVLAGDMNRGQRPLRIACLQDALRELGGGHAPLDALQQRMAEDNDGIARSADAAWIRMRARDLQFPFDGARMRLVPVGADIPFGTEADGSRLSDHMGYTIHYRLERQG